MLITVGESLASESIRMLMLHALKRAEDFLTVHDLKLAARWTLQVRAISLPTTYVHLEWLGSRDYIREYYHRDDNRWVSVWRITPAGREVHTTEENRMLYSVLNDLMRLPVLNG